MSTYKISSLLRLFKNQEDHVHKWNYQVEKSDTKHYVGSFDEIKNKEFHYDLKPGKWTVFSYHDHLSFHMIIHSDHMDSTNSVTLIRSTDDTYKYGHVLASWRDSIDEDTDYDSDDDEDWNVHKKVGFLMEIRGDIEIQIRMLKLKNDQIVAILFCTDTFLDDANEYLLEK